MGTLLALDLSTSCTGFAVFDLETKTLLRYGIIEPEVKGSHKLRYPKKALFTILDMAEKVAKLIEDENPQQIVIEEVNRGVSRISQKSLDALHFFILDVVLKKSPTLLDIVTYLDSNGRTGWRPALGIHLSEEDKDLNKSLRAEAKKKKLKKPKVVNWKTLSVRWVNNEFNLNLCSDLDPKTDGDIADSIALGVAFLRKLK